MQKYVLSSSLVCCFSFQCISWVMVGVIRRDRRGSKWIFDRWCTPTRNERRCLSVFGLSNFIIASVFVISGVIPVGIILNPNYSILVLANSHFWKLIARRSASSFCKTLSNSFSCFLSVLSVIISISSRNADLDNMTSKVLSIVFWNVAGISVRPWKPFMNLYVPVALPPSLLKLQCMAIDCSKGVWLYAYFRYILKNQNVPGEFCLCGMCSATASTKWLIIVFVNCLI